MKNEEASFLKQLAASYRKSIDCVPAAVTSCRNSEKFFENRICLTVSEFAVQTGLSTKSVERLIKRGDLQIKRVGRRVLIPKSAIEAWLNRKD